MADNWFEQYNRMFPDPYNPAMPDVSNDSPKPLSCGITSYHDYIAMNAHEVVFDPTPEDSERILRESSLNSDK